ncbi:MAG TPA: hypothetical protein PKN13_11125 [Accumulibacter sp.]|nr:hypothetical protein [Accumulibacter sp.]HNC18883.1 hypothetical protein [Accumulibacter sp.]HND80998.1 hypothetical protein [Accumulibacter sp.]HNG38862.1 hypothetical protein [Accumulibacter sp.]HNI72534.1 hypothetical protein [Accumulibacter sp.]
MERAALYKRVIGFDSHRAVIEEADGRTRIERRQFGGFKRILIAIDHKILRPLFIRLKRREHYRDSTTDDEALAVQHNAPRWIDSPTSFGFVSSANA